MIFVVVPGKLLRDDDVTFMTIVFFTFYGLTVRKIDFYIFCNALVYHELSASLHTAKPINPILLNK